MFTLLNFKSNNNDNPNDLWLLLNRYSENSTPTAIYNIPLSIAAPGNCKLLLYRHEQLLQQRISLNNYTRRRKCSRVVLAEYLNSYLYTLLLWPVQFCNRKMSSSNIGVNNRYYFVYTYRNARYRQSQQQARRSIMIIII